MFDWRAYGTGRCERRRGAKRKAGAAPGGKPEGDKSWGGPSSHLGRAPVSHRAPGWCPSGMGPPQITFGWAASCWNPRSSSHGAPAPAITARGLPQDGPGALFFLPSIQIWGFICLFARCSWIPLRQKATADAQPRAGGGGIVAGPNPGLSSAKTSPLPHEATTKASPNAPGPKKITTKQPGLILPQAHFQPRVGADSTPRAGLAPSIAAPIPQKIYHLQRAPSPRRGAQLLGRISSHLIPPRKRGGVSEEASPSPGSPPGSHSQLKPGPDG